MAKVRIVYGSETGNTESIAEMVRDELKAKGHEVDCQSAGSVKAENLAEGYDCVLMGASAWGIDSLEMQGDFDELAEDFDKMGLEGKKCAAFASGDTSYEFYCGAVDFIEDKCKEVNATVIVEGLKLEGDAGDNKSDIASWAEDINKAL